MDDSHTHTHTSPRCFAASAAAGSHRLSSYGRPGQELALVVWESCEQGVSHAVVWKFLANAEPV